MQFRVKLWGLEASSETDQEDPGTTVLYLA